MFLKLQLFYFYLTSYKSLFDLTAFIIDLAAILISSIVLNLPIPILIDEFDNDLFNPRLNNTCDDLGEDEVHADPDEIAIFGREAIID